MNLKPPDNDPKAIWQNQPTEIDDMSLQRLLEQAQKLAARSRRGLVRPLVSALIGTALGVFIMISRPLPASAVLIWIVVLTLLWFPTGRRIYAAYQVHRWVWPGQLRTGVAVNTSLDFYRAELDRQHRAYARMVRPWLLVVVGLGFGLPIVMWAVNRGSSLQRIAPFVFILAAWVVVSWYARDNEARRIEREIRELDEFENEN